MYEIYLYSTIAHTLTSLKMYYDRTVKEIIEPYTTTSQYLIYIYYVQISFVLLTI